MRRNLEHQEQAMLVQWAALAAFVQHPELELLYAIPNGGHRHRATAGRLKAEGVRAGVPDLCLPVARGGYHSLFLEMKAGKNRATAEQERWMAALEEAGHAVRLCRGFEEGRAAIEWYLSLTEPDPNEL